MNEINTDADVPESNHDSDTDPSLELEVGLVGSEETPEETAGFSRDPSDYAPMDHFLTRYSRDHERAEDTRYDPMITSDVIKTCIRDGALPFAPGTDRYRQVTDVAVEGIAACARGGR